MNLEEATQLALQGKLTEFKQEIHTVYDDEGPELQEFVNEIDNNYNSVFDALGNYSYGIMGEDIAEKGYEVIQDYIDDNTDLPIDVMSGKTEHANGIGNNNQREIIYHGEDGDKIIGYLCITDNMYQAGIIWVSDLSNKTVGFNNFNRISEVGAYTSDN